MNIYTIYKSPLDFPGDYVVKKWDCTTDPPKQDLNFVKLSGTLEGARAYIPRGLYNIGRQAADDWAIYESWL